MFFAELTVLLGFGFIVIQWHVCQIIKNVAIVFQKPKYFLVWLPLESNTTQTLTQQLPASVPFSNAVSNPNFTCSQRPLLFRNKFVPPIPIPRTTDTNKSDDWIHLPLEGRSHHFKGKRVHCLAADHAGKSDFLGGLPGNFHVKPTRIPTGEEKLVAICCPFFPQEH